MHVIHTSISADDAPFESVLAIIPQFPLKDVTPEQLIAAVRLVATGDALLAPSITHRLIERYAARRGSDELMRDIASLTERKANVLRLMARGLGNQEIAARLFDIEATVKTHVAQVLDKLRCENRMPAVVAAYEAGLVTVGG